MGIKKYQLLFLAAYLIVAVSCQCSDGEYLDSGTSTCLMCDSQCQTCTGSSSNCLTCPTSIEGLIDRGDGTFQCSECNTLSGYTTANDGQTCNSCPADCGYCDGTRCITCSDNSKYLDLVTYQCVNTCSPGYFSYELELASFKVCRNFRMYIDYTSESIYELGTWEYPYKNPIQAHRDIFNGFPYHPPLSVIPDGFQQFQLLYKQNVQHLMSTYDDFSQISGIWDLLVSSYDPATGEQGPDMARIELRYDVFEIQFETKVFPGEDSLLEFDLDRKLARGEIDEYNLDYYGTESFINTYETMLTVSQLDYFETIDSEWYYGIYASNLVTHIPTTFINNKFRTLGSFSFFNDGGEVIFRYNHVDMTLQYSDIFTYDKANDPNMNPNEIIYYEHNLHTRDEGGSDIIFFVHTGGDFYFNNNSFQDMGVFSTQGFIQYTFDEAITPVNDFNVTFSFTNNKYIGTPSYGDVANGFYVSQINTLPGQMNVIIENNTFYDLAFVKDLGTMFIDSPANIVIKNNTFDQYTQDTIDAMYFIQVNGESRVLIENNFITNSSIHNFAYIESPYSMVRNLQITDMKPNSQAASSSLIVFTTGEAHVDTYTVQTSNMESSNIIKFESMDLYSFKNVFVQGSYFRRDLLQLIDSANPDIQNITIQNCSQIGTSLPYLFNFGSIILYETDINIQISKITVLDSQIGILRVLGFTSNNAGPISSLVMTDVLLQNVLVSSTQQAFSFQGFTTTQFNFKLENCDAQNIEGTFLASFSSFNAEFNNVTINELNGKVIRLKPDEEKDINFPMKLYANLFTLTYATTNDDGGIVTQTNSEAFFNNSFFEGNSNYGRGGVFLVKEEASRIGGANSVFRRNIATRGGVVYSMRSSVFTCDSCEFYDNKAIEGGVIYTNDEGYFELDGVIIQNNYAVVGNVLFAMSSNQISKLSNFNFISNVYKSETWPETTVEQEKQDFISRNELFQDISLKVQKTQIVLSGNMHVEGESMLMKASASSDVIVQDASMIDVSIERLINCSESNLQIINTVFERVTTQFIDANYSPFYLFYLPVDSGLQVSNFILSSFNADIFFIDSTVKEISFDIFTIASSQNMVTLNMPISIKNSHLVTLSQINVIDSSTNQDQFFNIEKTQVVLTDSSILELKQRFMYLWNSPIHVNNFKAQFVDNIAESGLVFWGENSDMQIENSNFTFIVSTEGIGAAIVAEQFFSSQTTYSLNINNCQFIKNEAINGSSIFSTNMHLTIQNSIFEENEALQYGGAIYINCEAASINSCNSQFSTSLFSQNTAGIQGGAINYNRQPPSIEYSTTTFQLNSAGQGYGNNIGSYAAYAYFTNADTSIWTEQVSMYSSDLIPESIQISLFDWDNNLVTTSNGQLTVEPSIEFVNDISVSGQYLFDIVEGQATIGTGDSILLANQLTEGTIEILIDLIDDEVFSLYKPASLSLSRSTPQLQVFFSQCAQGYIFTPQRECYECPLNQYTYESGGSLCLECLAGAECLGGKKMELNAGMWRENNSSLTFYECLEPTACLGGVNSDCEVGYEDVICHECVGWYEGKYYARSQTHGCQECEPLGLLVIKFIGLFAVCIGYVVGMMVLIIRGASRIKDHSVLLRILTNYFQIVLLVRDLDLQWPDNVESILGYFTVVSSATQDLFQISCFFKKYADVQFALSKNAITMIFIGILPFAAFILCAVFWKFMAIIKKRQFKNTWWRNSVSMTIIFIFLIYPTIVNKTFENFRCNTVEGVDYLMSDFTVECWKSNHITQIFSIVLPCLIVWILGFPIFIFVILYKRKRNLDDKDNIIKYGLFYIGLTDQGFYWEIIVVNLRKIVIIAITVSLSKTSKMIQVLLIILCIYITLHLLRTQKPYNKPYLNFTDLMATLASIFTLICGMFFLEESTHNAQTTLTIVFVFIVLFNIVFLLYWMMSMIFALFTKAKSFCLNRLRAQIEKEKSFSERSNPSVKRKKSKKTSQTSNLVEEQKEELTEQDAEKGSERLMITKKTKATRADHGDKAMMGDRVTHMDQPLDAFASRDDTNYVVNVKPNKKKHSKKTKVHTDM